MLVGRQHPPEVTGALAMVSFTDEILSDSPLAQQFRDRFDLMIIPNLNPDGVEHGHWRHNMGGLDLNRDWGPFTQPETQAAKSVIDQIEAPGLALFLDFHSTRKNVFYTQPVGADGTEYGFTAEWLKRARAKLPSYAFDRQGAHNVDLPTSKTFIFEAFGIPAITYELGDETDRTEIAETARIFAQEMMLLLLEQE
jgi:murein tripeptide amidase MpaA